jgi:hypothetical protein
MMFESLARGDLVAQVDQASAVLGAWARILSDYRRRLVDGGFTPKSAEAICTDLFSEALCHALSADRMGRSDD